MVENPLTRATALKFETKVQNDGLLQLRVPLQTGARVTVFVIEESTDPFGELFEATQSSLDFWDNPVDDEDWNNA